MSREIVEWECGVSFLQIDVAGRTNAGKARMAVSGVRRIASHLICRVSGAVIPLLRMTHPKVASPGHRDELEPGAAGLRRAK